MPAPSPAERALAAALAGRSRLTARAYRSDLREWAKWTGGSLDAAADRLFAMTGPEANEHAAAWLASMEAAGLAPATIGRRLATLSAFLRGARLIGATTVPALELRRPKVRTLRDTAGVGWDVARSALEAAPSARDRAILALLLYNGLRRFEVAGLRVDDLDLPAGRAWVLGKGKVDREAVAISAPVVRALEAWLTERGSGRGALFTGRGGRPLSPAGVGDVAVRAGARVGAPKRTRAHSWRHTAVTEALRRGAPLQSVQRFARHSSPAITTIYADNLADAGGAVSDLLADDDRAA